RTLAPFLRFDLAVTWRCRGDQRVDQAVRDGRDVIDRLVERWLVCLCPPGRPAHVSGALQRARADLVVGGGRLEVREDFDISTHARISPWSAAWAQSAGCGDAAPSMRMRSIRESGMSQMSATVT